MSAETVVLSQQHWDFLRERAVADDVARERGYQTATKKSQLDRLGFGPTQQLVPALILPIHSIRSTVESYQLRADAPRLNEQGKARKYEMKAGGLMLLDVHPRLNRPREGSKVGLVANPAVPLFVTEGIPKADSRSRLDCAASQCLGFGTGEAPTPLAVRRPWRTGNRSR